MNQRNLSPFASTFLFEPATGAVTISLSGEVRETFGVKSAAARILHPADGELMAVVYVFENRSGETAHE